MSSFTNLRAIDNTAHSWPHRLALVSVSVACFAVLSCHLSFGIGYRHSYERRTHSSQDEKNQDSLGRPASSALQGDPRFPMTFTPGTVSSPSTDIFGLQGPPFLSSWYEDRMLMAPSGFPLLWGAADSNGARDVWRVHVHVDSDSKTSPPDWIASLYDSFQLNENYPEYRSRCVGRGEGVLEFAIPPEGSWTFRLECDNWLGTWSTEVDSDGISPKAWDAGLMPLGETVVRVVDDLGQPVPSANVNIHNGFLYPVFMMGDMTPWHPDYWNRDEIQFNLPASQTMIAKQLFRKRAAKTDSNGEARFRGVMQTWHHAVRVGGVGIALASDLVPIGETSGQSVSVTVRTERASTISAGYMWKDGTPIQGMNVACFREIRRILTEQERRNGHQELSWDAWAAGSLTDTNGEFATTASKFLTSPMLKLPEMGGPIRSPETERPSGRFLLAARGVVAREGKHVVVLHEQIVDLHDNAAPFNKRLPVVTIDEPRLLFEFSPAEEVEQRRGFPMSVEFRRTSPQSLSGHYDRVDDRGGSFHDGEEGKLWLNRRFEPSERKLWASFSDADYRFIGLRFSPEFGTGTVSGPTIWTMDSREFKLSLKDPPKFTHGQNAIAALPTFTYPSTARDGDFFALFYTNRSRYFGFQGDDPWYFRSRFSVNDNCRVDATPDILRYSDSRGYLDEMTDAHWLNPVHVGVYYRWASDGRRVSWSESEEITAFGNELKMPELTTPAVTLRLKIVDSRSTLEKLDALRSSNSSTNASDAELLEAANAPTESSNMEINWSPPGLDERYLPFQRSRADGNARCVLFGLIPNQSMPVRVIQYAVGIRREWLPFPELMFTLPAQDPGITTDWIVLDLKDGKLVEQAK